MLELMNTVTANKNSQCIRKCSLKQNILFAIFVTMEFQCVCIHKGLYSIHQFHYRLI
jgi:hypothetical protein